MVDSKTETLATGDDVIDNAYDAERENIQNKYLEFFKDSAGLQGLTDRFNDFLKEEGIKIEKIKKFKKLKKNLKEYTEELEKKNDQEIDIHQEGLLLIKLQSAKIAAKKILDWIEEKKKKDIYNTTSKIRTAQNLVSVISVMLALIAFAQIILPVWGVILFTSGIATTAGIVTGLAIAGVAITKFILERKERNMREELKDKIDECSKSKNKIEDVIKILEVKITFQRDILAHKKSNEITTSPTISEKLSIFQKFDTKRKEQKYKNQEMKVEYSKEEKNSFRKRLDDARDKVQKNNNFAKSIN